MLRFLPLTIFFVAMMACEKVDCIDCADARGNVFTFCDPAEPILDSLSCGRVYTTNK